MRKKIRSLDATPPKEIYRSIIVDYDVKLGVCELIDNAIDIWSKKGSSRLLTIGVCLDSERQKISITDNSGGIGEDEILLFISPGRSGNSLSDETIGIFGVGAKRAVVALAQHVKMTTRKSKTKTCQVQFDEDWLKDETWNIDLDEVDAIPPNTTIIELLGLRSPINESTVSRLKDHLKATYALFLGVGI